MHSSFLACPQCNHGHRFISMSRTSVGVQTTHYHPTFACIQSRVALSFIRLILAPPPLCQGFIKCLLKQTISLRPDVSWSWQKIFYKDFSSKSPSISLSLSLSLGSLSQILALVPSRGAAGFSRTWSGVTMTTRWSGTSATSFRTTPPTTLSRTSCTAPTRPSSRGPYRSYCESVSPLLYDVPGARWNLCGPLDIAKCILKARRERGSLMHCPSAPLWSLFFNVIGI